MALMLAPYNEAMRIGMGFNSYTQQLCVNDVVRKRGGVAASEKDLRSVDTTQGLPPAASDKDAAILCQPSGTIVKHRGDDGQTEVSQVVSWDAGFVNSLSDVTKSLNISGALTITCAALGGGGGANAHYVDSTKFLKSDAKYNIQVKVTNQKLVAEDVTEFTPIPNVPGSKFNEVYGDCFISGFIEGGVLSALVLKTLEDKDDKKNIGGGLNFEVGNSFISAKGKADGDYVDNKKEKTESTTITISWSGGGDIKPNNIQQWSIENLTQVAMEFPDRVAVCPQRTFAILTKYSSLRSFHEQTVKGSPLDYEIAGIYTGSLLDSYMEYKAMWSDLAQTIKEVDRGTARLRRREIDDKLIEYGKSVKEDYDKRIAKYNDFKAAIAKSPQYNNQISLEEPLPPNEVQPYLADTFGLDKASRDCRFEMIKIVREVNDVTADPKVATDPYRSWRYLSPNVFRMLLPSDKVTMPSPEEIAKMKADLEAKIQECAEKQKQIDDAKMQHTQNSDQAQQQAQALSARETELKSQLSEAEKKISELTQSLANAQQQVRDVGSREGDAQRRISELSQSLVKARQEYDALQNRFNELSAGPDITIYAVVYGGVYLNNANMENRAGR
ncbi:hypothetical protein B0T24DRAFT_664692 [Lasiosphaeria ovina]|uniref:Uncharacterized protein n=1 Tax=Lasiosphaeria ovina TaxID=92902 RepID=A0AAE0NG24_9PEZI|nr:hypothetical protein B0T24DRAFT_664692 [Lasiosphaeria ovina]